MLTDQDRTILDFETKWEGRKHGREIAILRTFGWRQARHQQKVAQIIAKPEALAEYPQLVHRLQGRAERRAGERDARLMPR